MIPQDFDKLTTQERRQHVAWISDFLGQQLLRQEIAHKRRKQAMQAQRQIENDYEGDENVD